MMRSWLCVLVCGCVASAPVDPLDELEHASSSPVRTYRGARGQVEHLGLDVTTWGATPREMAESFLREHPALIESERLRYVREQHYEDTTSVVFDVYDGELRVVGAELRVVLKPPHVLYVGGRLPRAELAGRRDVWVDALDAAGDEPLRSEPELVVFDPSLLMRMPMDMHLAWRLEVDGERAGTLLIDARSGDELLRISRRHDALVRETYLYNPDGANELQIDESGPVVDFPYGDATRAHDQTGRFDALLRDTFGRDGLDDAGMTWVAVVNEPGVAAHWDDGEAYFGPGWVLPDVLAHEYTHGLIAETAGLEYFMDSGAINESIADMFGSFLDTADPFVLRYPDGRIARDMRDPNGAGAPDHVEVRYDPPTMGACPCRDDWRCVGGVCVLDHDLSDHGGVHSNSNILNHAYYLAREGGTHVRSGITIRNPIGRTRSMHLVYRMMTMHLGAASGFTEYRVAARESAWHYARSETHGFTPRHCGAVLNSLAAVGIGRPDGDDDCFDDEVDNCPCLYNPEQRDDDCSDDPSTTADERTECLEPECERDEDCPGECSDAGYCVEPPEDPERWECRGPGQCAGAEPCLGDFTCRHDCLFRHDSCHACDSDPECGWCPEDGACRPSTSSCGQGDFATECADDCSTHDACGGCTRQPGCEWCASSDACVPTGSSCTDVRSDQSSCEPCDGRTCEDCATSGFCGWCDGTCVNLALHDLAMCSEIANNPGECGAF